MRKLSASFHPSERGIIEVSRALGGWWRICDKMLDVVLPEFFVICGSILLATFLLMEIFDRTDIFGPLESRLSTVAFGFPSAWKYLYCESGIEGEDSSINIKTSSAMVVQSSVPLKWNGYSAEPNAMTMINDGHAVVISGFWSSDVRPSIAGGPLSEVYEFHSMIFRWGASDQAGSEHSFDDVNYPLELQMIHVKRDFHSPLDAIALGEKHGVAVVTILFQITNVDNKCLDHVVKNLRYIRRSGRKVCIPPFGLDTIFPLFEKNYYSYAGSVIQETCSEVVTWIVQPKPVDVSSSQMAKFRNVCLDDVPMPLDGNPIQRQNERDLYYHD